ncbi:MAG: hypothetical protein HYT94_00865 [Parcubacteria group bacterium]|nr:hypothetical protein [Parcubacteria group bacterium]
MKLSRHKFLLVPLAFLALFLVQQFISFFVLRGAAVAPGIEENVPIGKIPPPLTGEEARLAEEITSKQFAPLSAEEQASISAGLSVVAQTPPPPLSPEEEAMRKQVFGL